MSFGLRLEGSEREEFAARRGCTVRGLTRELKSDPPDLAGERVMTRGIPPADGGRRPNSAAHRIDAACDRFEAAWRAGDDPRIEEFVGAADEPERLTLLRRLIALEVELRRGRGDQPSPGEYRDRFPGQRAVVDAVFPETAPEPGMERPRSIPTQIGRAHV